jgi:hypothetical protein
MAYEGPRRSSESGRVSTEVLRSARQLPEVLRMLQQWQRLVCSSSSIEKQSEHRAHNLTADWSELIH